MKYRIGIIISTFLAFSGCGTREGNGIVTIEFGNEACTAVSRTAFPAGVTSLVVCFKHVKLKGNDESGAVDLDFLVGEKTFDGTTTSVGEVSVPNGTYTRIEFLLDSKCDSGKSLQVTNAQGTFGTDKTLNLKFRGDFTNTEAGARLSLSLENIASALGTLSDGNQIKTVVEAAEGTYRASAK